jgi:hypothetical protein
MTTQPDQLLGRPNGRDTKARPERHGARSEHVAQHEERRGTGGRTVTRTSLLASSSHGATTWQHEVDYLATDEDSDKESGAHQWTVAFRWKGGWRGSRWCSWGGLARVARVRGPPWHQKWEEMRLVWWLTDNNDLVAVWRCRGIALGNEGQRSRSGELLLIEELLCDLCVVREERWGR